MLIIWKDFKGKANKTVSEFLKSVLIEAVSENYRHLMAESVQRSEECKRYRADANSGLVFNPPLRGKERIVSGIFATAISRVAQRSYPEARIDRPIREEMQFKGTEDQDSQNREDVQEKNFAGRVDYLAFYQGITVGFELKSAGANFDKVGNGMVGWTKLVEKRWEKVQEQAGDAVEYLLKTPGDYPNPVGLAVMTLVARRVKNTANDIELDPGFSRNFADKVKNELSVNGRDCFIAVWEMPEKFRWLKNLTGRESGGNVYTPAIAFVVRKFGQ